MDMKIEVDQTDGAVANSKTHNKQGTSSRSHSKLGVTPKAEGKLGITPKSEGKLGTVPKLATDQLREDSSAKQKPSVNAVLPPPEYRGPPCYQQPRIKSNKSLIKNAVKNVCLAGTVDVDNRTKALMVC